MYNRDGKEMRTEKKDILSRLVTPTGTKGAPATWHWQPLTNRDKRVPFVPVARPGTKGSSLLSRPGVLGWETGTKRVSQSGQISVSVVVTCPFFHTGLQWLMNSSMLHFINSPRQPCIIYMLAQ